MLDIKFMDTRLLTIPALSMKLGTIVDGLSERTVVRTLPYIVQVRFLKQRDI